MQRRGRSHRAVVFDLLYCNGDWTRRPCIERFEALNQLLLTDEAARLLVTEQVRIETFTAFEEYFESITLQGHEGIIGKRPDGIYEAGARSSRRIKIKPIDTVDAALTGYNRDNDLYLAGVYDMDADAFTPFAWVSSGLTAVKKEALAQERDRVAFQDSWSLTVADRRVDLQLQPPIVVEIEGDHIQPTDKYPCGLRQEGRGWTLRGARFGRLRPDKGPDDVTTLDEFLSLPVVLGYDPPCWPRRREC